MPWEKQFNVDDVLDKAMRTFWSRGYEATSVQDLVECTGINRGSLYATYGDKRELFLASLRHYDQNVRQVLVKGLERECGPREAIRRMFQAFVDKVTVTGPNEGCFLVNTALELSAHDAEVAKIIADAQKEIEAFFVRMVTNGQSEGELPLSLNPDATAQGLLATLLGILVLARSRPDPALLQSIADDAMKRLG